MKIPNKPQNHNRTTTEKPFIKFIERLKTLFSNVIIFSLFLSQILIFSAFPTTVQAQETRAVTVTADQPNIWTLEQAHYLLAQSFCFQIEITAVHLGEQDRKSVV